MKTDSTTESHRHIFFVEQSKSERVLVYGFSGVLFDALSLFLKKNDCVVYTDFSEAKGLKFSYIFHKNNLNGLTKTMFLAQKCGAKFVYIDTSEKDKNFLKAKEMIAQIRADMKIYLFHVPEPESLNQAEEIIHKIFQHIFNSSVGRTVSKRKISDKLTSQKKSKRFKIRLSLPLVVMLVLFIVLGYFISVGLSFYLAVKDLQQIPSSFSNGNLNQVSQKANQAHKLILYGEKGLRLLMPVGKAIAYQEFETMEDGYLLLKILAKTSQEAVYTTKLAQNIGQAAISSRTSLHVSQLELLNSEIDTLSQDMQLTRTQIVSLRKDNSKILKLVNFNTQLDSLEGALQSTTESLMLVKKFTEILPDILGYDEPKTFLLLFQNNSELRPTGGFIGSFGWVTFIDGRLAEFKTEDVYTADGQLKGHVSPPEPLKKYLGQENWYLRDSNYDPDFLVSARQAEWFLKHEMNLQFDGVFAFDLNSVQSVLRAINGVYLSDYNETINADNLFLKTQAISEIGFFPGSTQKKDFIGSLSRNIYLKLTTSEIPWAEVLNGLKGSLDEKHILVYFHNETAQQVVEKAGWGGRIASVACKTKDCVSDYLMLVEANLGINKANFLIDRQAKLTLNPQKEKINHELVINYSNESHDAVYPGGEYFSYTRILLPKGITLGKVSLSNEIIPSEDITVGSYQDLTMVEFPLRIPAQSKKELKISYSLPVSGEEKSVLELLVQKQPGIIGYDLDIIINGDQGYQKSFSILKDHFLSIPL